MLLLFSHHFAPWSSPPVVFFAFLVLSSIRILKTSHEPQNAR